MERTRYRDVLAHREFRAMFVADALSVLGDQVARIAVALLVYERTQSAFASAATYACSYLTWLIGGPLLSPLADRYRRRELMIGCDLARFALVAALVLPGLPLWAFFVALAGVGLLTPPFEAARSALLADILQGEQYVVANALTNAFAQAGQVGGFLLGGLLVAGIGSRGALAVDALTFALSALALRLAVTTRPAEAAPRTALAAELLAGVRLVFQERQLRYLLLVACVGSVALIVPETLAVAVVAERGGGPVAAGILTASLPAGFVAGSFLLLRLTTGDRVAWLPRLGALSCVPLLVSPWIDTVSGLTALWLVAGAGGALQLVANAAFVAAVPAHLRGRAYGVASTCLMTSQGLAVLIAGAVASRTDPRTPVALTAIAALGVLALLPHSRQGGGRHRVKR